MGDKIKQLIIRKFRGGTNETIIDFDSDKNIAVIFGENGTGKTSILDAIDFACNKNNDVSLRNKSIGSRKYKYLTSYTSEDSELEIQIETLNNLKCIAKLSNNGIVDISSELPIADILRRDAILKIVAGQPKDRFTEIRNMIAYSKIKQIEDSLREAQKNINKIYEDSIKAYHQEEENLKKLWEEESDKKKEFIQWAKERSELNKDQLEKEKTFWSNLLTHGKNFKESNEYVLSFEKETKEICDQVKELKDQLKLLEKGEVEKIELVILLDKAKKFIECKKEITECPVCRNKEVEKDKLLADLDARINQMKNFKTIQKNIEETDKKKKFQEKKMGDEIKKNNNIIDAIKDILQKNNINNESIKNFWDSSKNLELDKFKNKIIKYVEDWENKNSKKQEEYNQLSMIQLSYKNYKEKKEEAERNEKKSEKIKQLLDELESIRKEKIDKVLLDISDSVERMYSKVHPEEGIGAVKFYLDPKKAESLEFEGNFQGKIVPPQAYYSESHLDTLGVCVFLSLAQYNPDIDIVLLDDILTSVDQKHMHRFINMLEEESKHFSQIVIATHYRPWRDRYRLLKGKSGAVQLIELLPWNIEVGIRHTKKMFFIDELKNALQEKEFDRQKVGSKSGILLEGLLDELILKYSLKVPRKADMDYTLGELFDAFSKKIKGLLKVEKNSNTYELKEMINELNNFLVIRNKVGCHASELGKLFSDDEVKEFGEKTVEFSMLLICDNCGSFPNKNKSGSYWECQCQCQSLKLYPLQCP